MRILRRLVTGAAVCALLPLGTGSSQAATTYTIHNGYSSDYSTVLAGFRMTNCDGTFQDPKVNGTDAMILDARPFVLRGYVVLTKTGTASPLGTFTGSQTIFNGNCESTGQLRRSTSNPNVFHVTIPPGSRWIVVTGHLAVELTFTAT